MVELTPSAGEFLSLLLPLLDSLYYQLSLCTLFVRSPPFFHGIETHFAV